MKKLGYFLLLLCTMFTNAIISKGPPKEEKKKRKKFGFFRIYFDEETVNIEKNEQKEDRGS